MDMGKLSLLGEKDTIFQKTSVSSTDRYAKGMLSHLRSP
jgi:hypothetical protein